MRSIDAPCTARGIPAIKIDISFRADSSPLQGGAFSAHADKVCYSIYQEWCIMGQHQKFLRKELCS
jgi:predicted outer membrane repeat protein